jgi:hypothetical protein
MIFSRDRLALFLVIGFFFGVLILPSPVFGLKVDGSIFTGMVSPGTAVVHKMTVSSAPNDPPMDYQVDVTGFGQSKDKGYVNLDPTQDTSPYSARSFITLDNRTFHLEPGASQTINAKISVPQGTGPGGRYALILIQGIPKATGSTSIVTAINVPIVISVGSSGRTFTGMITDLKVSDVVPSQPITFTTSFKNTGNYHLGQTTDNITVIDAGGQNIALLSTNPSSTSIIPASTVDYKVNLDKSLSPGTYTAKSEVRLGDGTVLDTKTTTFEVKSNYVAPPTETSVTVSPNAPATLASSDGRITISFPAGAVISAATVTLKPVARDQLPAVPSDAKAGGTCFSVDGLSGLLSKDATIVVKYSDADLAAAGGDASKLVLARYDQSDSSKWTLLQTTVDNNAKTLTATTNRFSIWTVMASSSGAAASQTQAASGQKGGILSLDVTPVLLAIGLLIVVFGVWKRKKN